MAITQEEAIKIDNLVNEGMSLRAIAEKLGHNREFVRRYTKGKIEVSKESPDTPATQNDITPNTGSTEAKEGVPQEIGVSVSVADLQLLRQQVREDLDKFKEQIPSDITNDSLKRFKRETIGECKGVLSDLLVKLTIHSEDLEKRIKALERGCTTQIKVLEDNVEKCNHSIGTTLGGMA